MIDEIWYGKSKVDPKIYHENISWPTISVVIPSYNDGDKINIAIDSVLAQNYPSLDLIIVDGKSTDNTLKILDGYKDNLRYISKKDDGVYYAMNNGIDLAKGDWIYFLGADDILCEKIFYNLFSDKINHNYDILYGNVIYKSKKNKIYDGEFDLKKLKVRNICHQSIISRTDILKYYGKFKTKYKVWADYAFNVYWLKDENIKKRYIEIIFAFYDGTGFSSTRSDPLFNKEREFLFS